MDDVIARQLRGEATAQEIADLVRWRAASPENERHYRDVIRLLTTLRAAASADPLTPPRATDLLARMATRTHEPRTGLPRPRRASRWWVPFSIGAAACLLIVADLVMRRQPPTPAVSERTAAPTTITTGAGELATVRMVDGSVARLGPRSRLRLIMMQHERVVAVEGHVFFAVAKNPSRPFRVTTSEGDLVALGTRFDVLAEPKALHLAVVEGRVALLVGGEERDVGTGEASGVRNGATTPVVKLKDVGEVTRWMRRFLAFQATPLSTVATEIERVYGRRVVVADSALAHETVTAVFTDESLDDVVRVVCTVVGVQCMISSSQVTISR
jgi:ferric-dicitrate binding protein FerR (iron transport regulator)